MQFFIQAFGVGFILSIMVGPVFFVLLETSITKGIKAALALDFGVLISDIFYILIAVTFTEQIKGMDTASNKTIYGFVGGAVFICYGLFTLWKKTELAQEAMIDAESSILQPNGQTKDYILLGIKGFLLNFANPLVIFYWLSVASFANQFEPDKNEISWVLLFLGIVLLTFFGIDVLKILAAKKLRPLVNQKLLNSLNKVIGIIFCLFGIFLILQNILHIS